jgi:hypothetical protein
MFSGDVSVPEALAPSANAERRKTMTISSENYPAQMRIVIAALAAASVAHAAPAAAGNEANSVLYSHHSEPKGETEINVFNDFSRGMQGLPRYNAQLIEIEHAFTDKLTSTLYFETQKTNGDEYKVGGFRFETRYRPFAYGAFLNPVLYVEYESLRPDHRFKMEVVGRTDRPEAAGPARTEHAVETKLILGHDFSRNFDVAVNLINEANLGDGHWEFGYAAGLNATVYRGSANTGDNAASAAKSSSFELRRLKIGAEMFGGLGDSTLGLTASSKSTQQYAGLNLYAGFSNGMQVKVGAAAGLNNQSERALVRLMVGWEIK